MNKNLNYLWALLLGAFTGGVIYDAARNEGKKEGLTEGYIGGFVEGLEAKPVEFESPIADKTEEPND